MKSYVLSNGLILVEDKASTEPPSPSAEKVARRAIVLSVISCRGFFEGDRANSKAAHQMIFMRSPLTPDAPNEVHPWRWATDARR